MEIQNTPILGGTAPRTASRTAQKFANFALRWANSIHETHEVRRYLDVGCGNGFITEIVAANFDDIFGIDVEAERLEDFRSYVRNEVRFHIELMSGAEMRFSSDFFSLVSSFEVLEHVFDLDATVDEIIRVCKRGGVVVISVPQAWFPFENHGMRIGKKLYPCKIPFLPYMRPLHRKYSLARIFSSADMDHLFLSRGMELLETAYASPQFERAAANSDSWESRLAFLRNALNACETIPVLRELTGVSMLKAYQKAV
jgi:SAM-dependent methyltransferase